MRQLCDLFDRSSRNRRRRSAARATLAIESLETRRLLAATPIAGLSDEFDDAASTQQWQRLNEVEGWNADQLNVYDINTTQAGRMVQQPHTAVWYQDWRGPMAFQLVTGDFAFTTQVHVSDRDDIGGSDTDDVPGDGQFSLGGAMIRTPRGVTDPAADWTLGSGADDGTNNGENYVFLSLGYGAGANEFSLEVKTTRNSNSNLELTSLGPDANTVAVQIARIGDSILTMYQLPGEDWQVHRRYTRPDMPDTMQVGLVSYSDWTKANDFDPFTQNSTVLTPGMAGDPTPSEAFNPDITAGFEYARYALPDVPEALAGADLSEPSQVSDAELLSFLGGNANIDPTNAGAVDGDTDDVGNNDVDSAGSFQFVVAGDGVVDDWTVSSDESVSIDPVSSVHSHSGETSIAINFDGAGTYAGFDWRGAFPRTLENYDSIRFFVYVDGDSSRELFIGFNGTGDADANGEPVWFHAGPVIDVTAGEWTEVVIPVDEITGSPDAIMSISIQAMDDSSATVFVDDVALIGAGDAADHQQAITIANHPSADTHGRVDPVVPNWGINLFQNTSSSYEGAFVDVVRTWEQWGNVVSIASDGSYTTGPWERDLINSGQFTDQGVPLQDFGALMFLNSYPAGVYRMRFEGTADVRFESPVEGAVQIVEGSLQQDGNVTTLDVRINRPERDSHPYDGEFHLWVEFLNTDADDPVRNIQMISPGYDLETTQVYRTEFLRRLRPFSTIRFMQWNDTILTNDTTWADRRLPTHINQTVTVDETDDAAPHGPAWEFMIAMANESGSDAWLTVPHTVDAEYLTELATLWRDNLNEDLNLYVEYSNEIWNGQYPVHNEMNYGDYQIVAERVYEMSNIFHGVFDQQSDRLNIVLAGQAGNDFHILNALSWFDNNPDVGTASDYIDSISIAPYFHSGLPNGEADVDAIVVAQRDLSSEVYSIRQHARIAEAYGLELNAYEGGISFHDWETTSTDNFTAVHNDARLRGVYQDYASQWQQNRGELFTQFQLAGDQFGLLEDMRDPGSVKWDALMSVLLPSGDATLDAEVTFEDFVVLRDQFNEGPAANGEEIGNLRSPADPTLRWWEQGDFNGDNSVTAADFDLFYANLDQDSLNADQAEELARFIADMNNTNGDGGIDSGTDGGVTDGGGSQEDSGNSSAGDTMENEDSNIDTSGDGADTDDSGETDPSTDSGDQPAVNPAAPEMAIGMNLTMVNDWTHSWVFRDAFKLSRNFTTRVHAGAQHSFLGPPETDADGWVTSIPAPTVDEDGRTHIPYADSIVFSEGGNPSGIYRAEWSGAGEIVFVGAALVETGATEDGRSYALLDVPEDQALHTRIYSTDPADYIRDIQLFMPDYNGMSLEMDNWQPDNDESPFHPLFLERLEPFDTLRFMQWQQVNGDDRDVLTSDDLRPVTHANQGTTSRSPYNGVSVEYQVQLVNDLGANAYFNMPHQADDSYVRAFAEYVRDNIHDDAQVFVEYSNEVWNYAPGYRANRWIGEQQGLPENAGLTFVDVWAQEARRDFAIWSDVFSGQEDRLTRVAAGQQNNPWLTRQLLERMNGEFDAVSSTSYAGLGSAGLDWINSSTTQDEIIDWLLDNSVPFSLETQAEHAAMAEEYSQSLGREIQYVTYEGGSHLDAFDTAYQDLVHSVQDNPRFRDVYAALLNGMESLGIDMHTQYVFTSQGDPAPWGEFGVLHEMDQPIEDAHEYNALVDFINGDLQLPGPTVSIAVADGTAHEFGDTAEFTVSRSGDLNTDDLTVYYTVFGSATGGVDYEELSGFVVIPAGETLATITVAPILDSGLVADEGPETIEVVLSASDEFRIDVAQPAAIVTLLDNEFSVIGDQTMFRNDDALEIPVVDEIGGETVSYSAHITENLLAELLAEHQLDVYRADFSLDWGGHSEKWLRGNAGYYYLLPSAELFLWSGSFEESTRLAGLEDRFYDDPELLIDAEPVTASASMNGSTLVIDPDPDFVGSFEVQLTATTGGVESLQTFMVSVHNAAPTIEPLDDQAVSISGQLRLNLDISDPAGDELTISARVQGTLASQLRDEFELYADGRLADWGENWGGQGDKWLRGNSGDWFFLLPDGSLNQWAGSFEDSSHVGVVATEFYDDPQLLLDATSPSLAVEVVDGQLVLTPQGQAGTFDVEVTVSDGEMSDSTVFAVTVTNSVPVLSIGDHSLVPGEMIELDLPTEDTDGQTLEYTVELLGDEVSALDAQHDFWSDGQYWTNHLGNSERWIRDADNGWHYLLPSGELFRWEGSFESSTLLADLGSEFYDDPSLLTDPQPVVQAIIENGTLRVTAAENFTGYVEFRIRATDGSDTVEEIILIEAADLSVFTTVDAVFEDWNGLE